MTRTKERHSPSSHPRHRITVRSSQRSVLLLELFAIVLCRRIHFLSVKTSHYFSSNIGTPEFNPQGTQDNRQFEQISNNWRAGFLESQPQLHHPLIAHLEGRPRTCTSSIFGTFSGEPPRPKRFNQQDRWTGQQPTLNSLRKLRSIFLTFKNHLWQRN